MINLYSLSNHVQIVISSTELFDYSEGEPPAEYLTVLRALEVSISIFNDLSHITIVRSRSTTHLLRVS